MLLLGILWYITNKNIHALMLNSYSEKGQIVKVQSAAHNNKIHIFDNHIITIEAMYIHVYSLTLQKQEIHQLQ